MSQALKTAGEPRVQKSVREVIRSDAFRKLVKTRWTVSFVLLALLFVTYYGFILLVSTQKAFVSTRIGEVTTLAIPLGIGTIVIAWALTALYVGWANAKFDPEVERLKDQLRR